MMCALKLNLSRFRCITYNLISRRNKYIVLLPEVPPDTAENNPLLRTNVLPSFSQLTAEKCVNAAGKLVIEHEAGIHQLDQKLNDSEIEKNVQNIILPLDRLSTPLEFAWGAFKILYIVQHRDNVAESYVKLHPRIIKAKQEKYLQPSIHQAFKELKANEKQFTQAVQRIIDKYLLESSLFGMNLSNDDYKHFQSIILKLEKHRTNYRDKLHKSTNMFSYTLDFNDVKNFPLEILKLMATDPTNPSKGPWKLNFQPHIYNSFLQYCDNKMLRWSAWSAYNARASAVSGAGLNNSIEIEEIRYQRSELAKLLGFNSFAEMSMKTKMAGSVENVMEMITTLHVKSKLSTAKEVEELEDFAKKNGLTDKLDLWDVPYWQRLYKEEQFNVDEAAIRQYFPFPTVLKNLFKLFRQLFGVTIKEATSNVDKWHEDVTFYKIYDENDKEIASFYMDPYLRSGKMQGTWMEIGRNRSDVVGSEPLSYLVFNFHPPSLGKPSLLSFNDLKTLLRKFGHVLQHSLTTIPYNEVSGLTNLEWDIVNVCPLVMSSFLKHYATVSNLSSHVDTGKPIPEELHESIIKADQFMLSLRLTEELNLSALDLELHSRKEYWLNITKNVWTQYMPFPYEKDMAHPCSFPQIFCDQHPAAYFSHLWAEMIACDVFSAFEEVGLDNKNEVQQVSQRFRDTFLALGGGCHPGEIFRKFRGRDPCTDAFLANYRVK